MKVRVYPLSERYPDYYFEHYFKPNYGLDGEIAGFTYDTNNSVYLGWYGYEIFKRDINMGIIKIIENIKPKQELKKLSFV